MVTGPAWGAWSRLGGAWWSLTDCSGDPPPTPPPPPQPSQPRQQSYCLELREGHHKDKVVAKVCQGASHSAHAPSHPHTLNPSHPHTLTHLTPSHPHRYLCLSSQSSSCWRLLCSGGGQLGPSSSEGGVAVPVSPLLPLPPLSFRDNVITLRVRDPVADWCRSVDLQCECASAMAAGEAGSADD